MCRCRARPTLQRACATHARRASTWTSARAAASPPTCLAPRRPRPPALRCGPSGTPANRGHVLTMSCNTEPACLSLHGCSTRWIFSLGWRPRAKVLWLRRTARRARPTAAARAAAPATRPRAAPAPTCAPAAAPPPAWTRCSATGAAPTTAPCPRSPRRPRCTTAVRSRPCGGAECVTRPVQAGVFGSAALLACWCPYPGPPATTSLARVALTTAAAS